MRSLFKGAMHCLQAKPYKYRCSSCQAAVTSVLANRLFHVLGKDYFMLHKILWLHNSAQPLKDLEAGAKKEDLKAKGWT